MTEKSTVGTLSCDKPNFRLGPTYASVVCSLSPIWMMRSDQRLSTPLPPVRSVLFSGSVKLLWLEPAA
jgi:hypothetical protein